ncbi:MAG: MATE family efflux transporter [Bacillota bacterium]|nr:MATE family efflux transporter [Bacillota bacterium]
MDRSKELGEKKISKLLLQFSLPAIVAMLVNALYNVVDRIFVGNGVGDLAIAGITIGFPVMLITMAFSMLVGMGATSLISIRLGQQKKEEAEQVVGNAFLLLLLISSTMAVLGLVFLETILQAFGASKAVLPYASSYLGIILIGTPLMGMGMGLNNFIRAEGNPKMAMNTMLIGFGTNIILDYLFIFPLGMGIQGAALATVISQGISASWVLYYFLFGKSLIKIRVKYLKLQPSIYMSIFAIGLAPFAMQLTNSLQQVILNKSLAFYGGDLAVSAMGILFSVLTLLFMPIIGLSQGVQPIIGFNYGAMQYDRVKETLKIAIVTGTVIVICGYAVVQIWPEQIVRLFTDNVALIEMGSHGIRTFLLMLPVIGFQIIGSNYFQAVGKAKQAAILSLSRQVLIFIPLLLILPHFWGLEGIWRTAPLADITSVILTAVFLVRELKHLETEQQQKISKQDDIVLAAE